MSIRNFAIASAVVIVATGIVATVYFMPGAQPSPPVVEPKQVVAISPKSVRVLLSPLTVSVRNIQGEIQQPMIALILVSAKESWAGTLCEREPRLIGEATEFFDDHPVIYNKGLGLSLVPSSVLMEMSSRAFRDIDTAEAIHEMSLHQRSAAVTFRKQAGMLHADFICVEGKPAKL